MAGIFVTFVIEYFSHRLVDSQKKKKATARSLSESSVTASGGSAKPPGDTVAAEEGSVGEQVVVDNTRSVAIMEAGIIFHSICKRPHLPLLLWEGLVFFSPSSIPRLLLTAPK